MAVLFDARQVAEFEKLGKDDFLKDVEFLCQKSLPAECADLSKEDLAHAVRLSVRRGERCGLTWKSNLATVCLLDLRYRRPVLEVAEFKEHITRSTTPDRVFRHLFVGEFAHVWQRMETPGGE